MNMNELVFTEEPPKQWDELCTLHGDLFNTAQWHNVLSRGFQCETIYGWDEENQAGISITVFKAGPFRIGYVGFPVGGTIGKGIINYDTIASLKKATFPCINHLLRIPVSAFLSDQYLPLSVKTIPETAIENLQEWIPEKSYKFRRMISKARNKAERLGMKITDADEQFQGDSLFTLYRDTIIRNKGKMRYNEEYFSALLALSKSCEGLRCMSAIINGNVAGFVIVAFHQNNAYCLHSAFNVDIKNNRSNDLLFYKAIIWAKESGMKTFNFIASPPNQPSLIQYKEKWGGVTMQQKVYDLPLRPLQAIIFKNSVRLYDGLYRFIK